MTLEADVTPGKRQQCRLNILNVAADLLEEQGYLELTIEEVASRAGAGKQTIYRNWGTKRQLALDAFAHRSASQTPPDTGSLHEDLTQLLTVMCSRFSNPGRSASIAGLLAEAQEDPEFGAAVRDTLIATKRRTLRLVFQRGMARGEVDPSVDVETLLDLVHGPVWYRMLISGQTLDRTFSDELVRVVVRAAQPPLAAGIAE